MNLELGVYSFGDTPRTSDGGYGPTAQAIRNVLEAVTLAEDVGVDFFGFGEHHTRSMPLSSPTSLVTAAAASTERIKLGTTVTVLSTDEPLRVFQQLATAAIARAASKPSPAAAPRRSRSSCSTSTSATTTCSTPPSWSCSSRPTPTSGSPGPDRTGADRCRTR